MINLPKPSPLNSNNNDYMIGYLQQLVSELERVLSGLSGNNKNNDESRAICDISIKDDKLLLVRIDGSVQSIDLGD